MKRCSEGFSEIVADSPRIGDIKKPALDAVIGEGVISWIFSVYQIPIIRIRRLFS